MRETKTKHQVKDAAQSDGTADGPAILAQIRAMEPEIQAAVPRMDQARTLPRDLVDRFLALGIYRTHVPKVIGGLELPAPDYFEIVEELARINGSAGWLAMINSGNFLVELDQATAEEIFNGVDPYAVCSVNRAPKGRAMACPGGYRVSGRWSFASGIPHAQWVSLTCVIYDGDQPCLNPDGTPLIRCMFFPEADYRILDTWNALGMRGSGSHDVEIQDAFVPEAHVMRGSPQFPGPLFKAGFFLMGHAAHACGIARAAIDAMVELGGWGRSSRASSIPRQPLAQATLAQAEADLQAARRFAWTATVEAYAAACREGPIPVDLRMLLRLSLLHAVKTCSQLVTTLYQAAGPSAVYYGSPLEQCFRDIHTAEQHGIAQSAGWLPLGQYLFTRNAPDGPVVASSPPAIV